MKLNRLAFYLLIVAAPFLLAMGIMGDPPALDKAPEPKTRLDAVVVDSEGTTTEITHVSYDGELYLPVRRGKAIVTVPFQKIARLEFGLRKNSSRQVTIHFRDGREELFRIDDKVLFVGKLPFGTYQIQVKDLESVTFLEPAAPSVDPGSPRSGKSQT